MNPDSSSSPSALGTGTRASHLQTGHSGLREDSHWSMHSMWKRCLHGSTRSFSPSLRMPMPLSCLKMDGNYWGTSLLYCLAMSLMYTGTIP